MKWNVGKKIASGYLVALLILIVIGFIGVRNSANLLENGAAVEHTLDVLRELQAILSELQDAETGQRGYIITGEDRYLEPYNSGAQNVFTMVRNAREETIDNPLQQQRIDSLEPRIEEKLAELQLTIDLRRNQGFEAALAVVLTDQGKATMDDIRARIDQMTQEENRLLAERTAVAEASAARTQSVIILGVVLAVGIMTGVGFVITRGISVPLQEISATAKQISEGRLDIVVPMNHRQDEVGDLAKAFEDMIGSFRDVARVAGRIAEGDLTVEVKPRSDQDTLRNALATMVTSLRGINNEIREAVEILGTSTTQIGAAASQLVASATETATVVSQVSATVQETRQTAEVSNEKAKEVSDSAEEAKQISQSGAEIVKDTARGMGEIQSQMEAIAHSVVALSEHGQAIGDIITTVEDVASQSNLLAVNAAIEAAKAGEQGKGFAVVADEVRNLADQSSQATTKVRALLSDIQKATGTAVMVTEQGSKIVNIGVEQANEAGGKIENLAKTIAEAARAGMQISASSRQQLTGMDQLAAAMDGIKQATNQTTSSSAQLEVSAKELADLNERLSQVLSQYRM